MEAESRPRRQKRCSICGETGHNRQNHDAQGVTHILCRTCGETKPVAEMNKEGRTTVRGKPYVRVRNECRECGRRRCKRHYRGSFRARFSAIIGAARTRGRRGGPVEIGIDADFLLNLLAAQNGVCHYTGIELTHDSGKHGASVDRLDPTHGYVPGNVVLCLWIVNHMKSDQTVEEFTALCAAVATRAGECPREAAQAAATGSAPPAAA